MSSDEMSSTKKSTLYTRTGDAGTTALLGGGRAPKDELLFHALGSIDELSANIG